MLIPIIVFALFVGATTIMPPEVYSSWWWLALWTIVAAGLTYAIFHSRLWHRPAIMAIHLALLLVLAGEGATSILSSRGEIHLSPGSSAKSFIDDSGNTRQLPFTIRLQDFHTEYYPGMSFPKDFHSKIEVTDNNVVKSRHSISMNHIADISGYRFYQQSLDGKGGTILGVNHDPIGIILTYSGYILYALAGLIWLIFPAFRKKKTEIDAAAKQLSTPRTSTLCCLAMVATLIPSSVSASVPVISEERAEELAEEQVIYQGHVVPYNTVCRQLCRKLTGGERVGDADAVQFISSLTLYQEEWLRTPFMKVKGDELRASLGLSGDYIAPTALYASDGSYRLATLQGRSKTLDAQILRLDEKTALLGQLLQGELFTPIKSATKDANISLLSPGQVRIHIIYENLMPWKWWFMLTLLCALLMFTIRIFKILSQSKIILLILSLIPSITGVAAFAAEWIVVRRIPLASSSEIMLFMAVIASLLSISIVVKRHNDKDSDASALLSAMAMLMAGGLGMVGWLGMKEGMLSPLMPVLASPWLAAHVSIIMVSYVLLAMTFPAAILLLISTRKLNGYTTKNIALKTHNHNNANNSIAQNTRFIYAMLRPGVYLMGVGIFLGAMWANVSWGRYWAWDPKETWALVAWIIYALPLHPRFFSLNLCNNKKIDRSSSAECTNHNRTQLLAIYLLFAILSLLMTYIGVNYLPSLHAYA